MKTNHTKGEWKYSYGVNDTIDVYSQFSLKEYKNICKLPISETRNGKAVNPELTKEAEANAKLIAAASEMLENEKHNGDVMLAVHTALSYSNFNKDYAQKILHDAMVKTLVIIKKATE